MDVILAPLLREIKPWPCGSRLNVPRGAAVGSGCITLFGQDVIDLYVFESHIEAVPSHGWDSIRYEYCDPRAVERLRRAARWASLGTMWHMLLLVIGVVLLLPMVVWYLVANWYRAAQCAWLEWRP